MIRTLAVQAEYPAVSIVIAIGQPCDIVARIVEAARGGARLAAVLGSFLEAF